MLVEVEFGGLKYKKCYLFPKYRERYRDLTFKKPYYRFPKST